MPVRSKWQRLATERVNPRLGRLDTLSAGQIVDVMIRDSQQVLVALRRARPRIARASSVIAHAVLEGGRLIFVGAGTSGRLGVLEAAELPPTFGIDPRDALAIMAGGRAAVFRAREGVEDDQMEGDRALRALRPTRKDVVVAVSASGVTPFVRGAVSRAKLAGTPVIAIACNPSPAIAKLADISIVLTVGPEVIAGSTRLKAGTVTKVALNILTTTAMIRAGKTYGNLMVDVGAGSEKLRDRARRILVGATGLSDDQARELLRRAGGSVKAAILMQRSGLTRKAALSRLRVEPRLRKLLGRR